MEPRDMKYNEVSTSPWCTRVSPGGACVVRNFNERALKHTHFATWGFCLCLSRITGHALFTINTSNSRAMRRWRPNSSSTSSGLGADKYRLVNIRETLWARCSCQCRWCKSTRATYEKRVLAMSATGKGDILFFFKEKPHVTWKYSSRRCLSGFGIWWNLMNSRTLSIWVWYLAVPEYNRWMIADTLPNMLAYMSATQDQYAVNEQRTRLVFTARSELIQ